MQKSIRRFRQRAFDQQAGLCFYCRGPMWCTDPLQFAQCRGISLKVARWFQCTAEHLVPVSQGGRNAVVNIVATCLFCNQTRHKAKTIRSPESYAAHVRRRLAGNRWLPRQAFTAHSACVLVMHAISVLAVSPTHRRSTGRAGSSVVVCWLGCRRAG